MKTLVLGASGATGKHLVEQLITNNHSVKIIVRSPEKLPEHWKNHGLVRIIQGNIGEVSINDMSDYIRDCDSVACCLGHNLTWKGIYGQPRRLVRDATQLVCKAIQKMSPSKPIRIVLMNTSGNRNRDLNEPISVGERLVISLLRLLLPPHPDNEKAADYLRVEVGQKNPNIEWVVVRPDTLIDEVQVSEYSLYPSPIRSALFNPGKTSRINVGHFMATLLTDQKLWDRWKGQMPLIYNSEK